MSLTKKLLILSLLCGLCVFGIIYFEDVIVLHLLGEDKFLIAAFRWVVGVLALIAGGIPFCIYAVHISKWIEGLKEDSILYSDKKDDP